MFLFKQFFFKIFVARTLCSFFAALSNERIDKGSGATLVTFSRENTGKLHREDYNYKSNRKFHIDAEPLFFEKA